MPNIPPKLHDLRGGFGCRCFLRNGGAPGERKGERGRGKGFGVEANHRGCPSGSVAFHSAGTGVFASTASAIEAGMGLVFSTKLRIGMIRRKKPK